MIARPATSAPYVSTVRCLRPWLIGPLLFLCILSGYLLSFNVDKPTHNADWFIRYQVACSIVERNAFDIRPYRDDGRTGPGVGGHKYAQYTLGQTTALIPFYLLGRRLAGLAHTDCASAVAPPIVFLTAKLLDPLLGALLCVLFFATARLLGYTRRASLALTLLLAFGTALWPDVLSNEEHTMESLFLLAGAYAALRYTLARRKSWLWVLAMGVAAGLVFVTRVAGIIALPIFALYLLVLHRRWRPMSWKRPFLRDFVVFSTGALPAVVINAVFDVLRFGSPLRTGPYPDQSFGYPPWLGILNLLIGPGKGLVWYVPALFVVPVVARLFWRRLPLPTALLRQRELLARRSYLGAALSVSHPAVPDPATGRTVAALAGLSASGAWPDGRRAGRLVPGAILCRERQLLAALALHLRLLLRSGGESLLGPESELLVAPRAVTHRHLTGRHL